MKKRYGRRQIHPVEGLMLLDGRPYDKTVRLLVSTYGCSESAAQKFLKDATTADMIDRQSIREGTAIGLFKSVKLLTLIDRENSDDGGFQKGRRLEWWRAAVRKDEKFAAENGFTL